MPQRAAHSHPHRRRCSRAPPRATLRAVGFVDLHSHILPGLDDGARDVAASDAMVAGLAALGFDTLSATPHQKQGQFLPDWAACEEAFAGVCARAAATGLDVRFALGAENMWDTTFYERSRSDSIPGYDGSATFLFELPPAQLPVGLFERLFELCARGKRPVLAHPERYQPLWGKPELVEQLAASCALVVDLGAVSGYHGRKQAKAARALLRSGLAHAAASDAHTPDDLRPVAEGIAWIEKKLGGAAVTRLLDDNPRRILAGADPA